MTDLFDFARERPHHHWPWHKPGSVQVPPPGWLTAAVEADRVRFLDGRCGPFAVIFGDDGNVVARPGDTLAPGPDGGVVLA